MNEQASEVYREWSGGRNGRGQLADGVEDHPFGGVLLGEWRAGATVRSARYSYFKITCTGTSSCKLTRSLVFPFRVTSASGQIEGLSF